MAAGRNRRAEQLRRAKRAQRARERARGLRLVQLTLPDATVRKLRVAARDPDFAQQLDRLLDDEVVTLAKYPALADLAWNLHIPAVTAREAFALYERNWRLVDVQHLSPRERALIGRLAARFGAGLIHA